MDEQSKFSHMYSVVVLYRIKAKLNTYVCLLTILTMGGIPNFCSKIICKPLFHYESVKDAQKSHFLIRKDENYELLRVHLNLIFNELINKNAS